MARNSDNNSNGSGSNGNKDKKDEISKERKMQEALVLQDFFRATQRKVEEIRGKIGMSSTPSDLNLSDPEKRILRSIQSAGMVEGCLAGIGVFFILRKWPRFLENRMARARQQQQHQQKGGGGGNGGGGNGGYTLDSPTSVNSPFRNSGNNGQGGGNSSSGGGGMMPSNANPNNAGADLPPNRGGLIWRGIMFTTDLSLSFIAAAYTSAYFADKEQLSKSITEIPLLEGRSTLSDNFCPVLVDEYRRQWNINPNATNPTNSLETAKNPVPPFDRKPVLSDPKFAILRAYMDFTKNCQRRQAVERQIRQERGMGPNEAVEIPSPGVSLSSDWNDDDANDVGSFAGGDGTNNGNNDDGTFQEDDFYNGETQLNGDNGDSDWTKDDANGFVEDQEDSSRRRK